MKTRNRIARSLIGAFVATAVLIVAPPAAAGGGTISGKITFKGTVPAVVKMPINKDQETCGKGQRIVEEIRIEDGALLDAAVFIDGKVEGAPAPAEEKFELLQKGCRFNPFLSRVPRGETLKIVNGDPVAHNIHAYELIGRARRDLFNFQQPHEGHTKEQKVKTRKTSIVQLQCDIHDFMRGWIIVPRNPFFALGDGGRFELKDVPPGEYKLIAFHPVLGSQEKKVKVTDGATVTANFEFKAK